MQYLNVSSSATLLAEAFGPSEAIEQLNLSFAHYAASDMFARLPPDDRINAVALHGYLIDLIYSIKPTSHADTTH